MLCTALWWITVSGNLGNWNHRSREPSTAITTYLPCYNKYFPWKPFKSLTSRTCMFVWFAHERWKYQQTARSALNLTRSKQVSLIVLDFGIEAVDERYFIPFATRKQGSCLYDVRKAPWQLISPQIPWPNFQNNQRLPNNWVNRLNQLSDWRITFIN